MKRYLVFAGDIYYPRPGMEDFIDDFEDAVAAIAYAKGRVDASTGGWVQVYDSELRKVIFQQEKRV